MRGLAPVAIGRRLVGQRQVEREGAALAGRALDPDFAAEEAGDLAADREAEAGAVESDLESQALLLGNLSEGAVEVVLEVAEGDIRHIERGRARLDLSKVEDVVDQGQEVGAAFVDRARELDLTLTEVAVAILRE